jgi:hypothetical protein
MLRAQDDGEAVKKGGRGMWPLRGHIPLPCTQQTNVTLSKLNW